MANRTIGRLLAVTGLLLAAAAPAATVAPKPIKIKGEIIDSWCQISGIMGPAVGTAHHLCAIWCATGGIPVGLMGDDGTAYVLLKADKSGVTVRNPAIIDIQSDHVSLDAELYQRDGVNYLVVTKMTGNDGIINLSHKELGILPFGE
jgi:hypothetical protein